MRSREPRIRFRRIGDRFRTSSSIKDAENREMNILKKKLFWPKSKSLIYTQDLINFILWSSNTGGRTLLTNKKFTVITRKL